MSRLRKAGNSNGYSEKQTDEGIQVTKIAPYDNTKYYWGIFDETNEEAKVYKDGKLINTIPAESVQDLIDELTMINSQFKPNIDKS